MVSITDDVIYKARIMHKRDFSSVLFQMTQNIIEKRVERGIIRCEACDEWCKADCAHADAPIEHGCHTIIRNDWLICNHYMCRYCINALINEDRPVYTCDVCDEDITWWLQELRADDDWWEIDEDEEYIHDVRQDVDSGAETDDEDRHIVRR
jgi:hypothetical protein